MQRILASMLALAALTATASAQTSTYATQAEAAPIERAAHANTYTQNGDAEAPAPYARPYHEPSHPTVASSQPAQGIWVRSNANAALTTVKADAARTELRLDRGTANVIVHHPLHDSLVLVDLPGGQTQLLKNGLYTFNADTNTVRVLDGEASVFAGQSTSSVKVKEDHAFTFGLEGRSVDVGFEQARADLLPGAVTYGSRYASNYGDGPIYRDDAYGYPGFYGGYGYPYGGYGYGGWGYPYGGYGYPYGIGIGIGYGGGWGRGYYGGGGFRGGGFRGRR